MYFRFLASLLTRLCGARCVCVSRCPFVRAADFGHREYEDYDAEQRRRRMAKCFVEHDRQLRAREAGYETHTTVRSAPPQVFPRRRRIQKFRFQRDPRKVFF